MKLDTKLHSTERSIIDIAKRKCAPNQSSKTAFLKSSLYSGVKTIYQSKLCLARCIKKQTHLLESGACWMQLARDGFGLVEHVVVAADEVVVDGQ